MNFRDPAIAADYLAAGILRCDICGDPASGWRQLEHAGKGQTFALCFPHFNLPTRLIYDGQPLPAVNPRFMVRETEFVSPDHPK